MQSFFKTYFTPQDSPPDLSDVSDSEAESEIELQTETKKVLAGGDELSHYEAPKPWTIRKPVYDKPLPAPKATPQLGTEDRIATAGSTQAMEGIPELHAPSPQGRRDSRSRNKPFDSSMEAYEDLLSKKKNKGAEFEEVPLREELPAGSSDLTSNGGPAEGSRAFDLEAQTYAAEETASTKAMEMYESRVTDRHFPVEIEIPATAAEETASTKAMDMYESRVADRHFPVEVEVAAATASKTPDLSPLEKYDCRLSGHRFKQELTLDEIMSLSHARKSRVSFVEESMKDENEHDVKLVSPPPFIPSPLEDENADLYVSIQSIKEVEESGEAAAQLEMRPTELKIKTPEPYEPDETDLAWLYGSKKDDIEFGMFPSGLVKIASEESSLVLMDLMEAQDADIENESVTHSIEGSDVEPATRDVEGAPRESHFTLGDINWKKGIKEKKKPIQLESITATALEPNKKESPYLHTDKTSVTAESLELALAEAGRLVREEGIPKSPNQLMVAHEAQEAGIGPLEPPSILTTKGALELTTRITFAGASIGILMKAAHECREIDRRKRWEAKPREDFDRVLRELQFRFPIIDGPPDYGIHYNRVMAELKLTVRPYEPEEAQVVAGAKRGSLFDEDDSGLRKRAHQDKDYPLEEIVIHNSPALVSDRIEYTGNDTGVGLTGREAVLSSEMERGLLAAQETKTKDDEIVEATVDEYGNIIVLGSAPVQTEHDGEKPVDVPLVGEADNSAMARNAQEKKTRKRGKKSRKTSGVEKEESQKDKEQMAGGSFIGESGKDSACSTEASGFLAGKDELEAETGVDQTRFSKSTEKENGQGEKKVVVLSSVASSSKKVDETIDDGDVTAGSQEKTLKKKKKSKKKKAGVVGTTEVVGKKQMVETSKENVTELADAASAKGKPLTANVSSSTAAIVASVASRRAGGGGASMDQWAATRYQEWMKEASSHAEQAKTAESTQPSAPPTTFPTMAPRDPELDELASATLTAIDVSRDIKGDRDEHGRSYDWPFWSRLVQAIEQNPYSESVQALKPSVIEHIVNGKYAGCPSEVRKFLWLYLSDNHVPNNMLTSESRPTGVNPIVKDMVSIDVERTYPKSEEYSTAKKNLKDALQAYAAEDPAVGYSSAVALIGGVLALELDQDQTLTLLKRMMFHYGLRRQYISGLEGTRQRTYQFERLLERFRPELAHHLSEIGCPTENIVGQWLATMYGYRSPFDLVFQVYDLFLMEGYPALFKVALALFSENEKELMAANDKAEALDFFAHHVYEIHGTDYKRWLEVAGRFDISQEYLEEMCKSFSNISKQSHNLAAEQELHGTRSENDAMAAQLRYLTAQMDAMMLDRERFIRENVGMKMQIMDLMEQNYRLNANLYEERAERARDLAVGERELHHLAALYQHRIEALEKKVDACTCKRQDI